MSKLKFGSNVFSPGPTGSFLIVLALLVLAASAPAAPWKFALMGDCRGLKSDEGSKDGVRVSVLTPLALDAVKSGVNLVVFSGDLVNGGVSCGPLATQLAAWKDAMTPLHDAGVPIYCCRGNHETHQGAGSGAALKTWLSFFPNLPQNGPDDEKGITYKVEYANATFITFDQFIHARVNGPLTGDLTTGERRTKTGMMSPWVLEQVRSAETPWIFVFSHEMAFPGHHTDCFADAPAERNALWDALGVKGGIYMSGHDHLYVRRTAPDSAGHPVMELVLGCTGAPQYPYDEALKNLGNNEPYVPVEQFVNAKVQPKVSKKNTNDYPQYFGYLLFTVDGGTLTGQWRALTNYNAKTWSLDGEPKFESLDTFTVTRPSTAKP